MTTKYPQEVVFTVGHSNHSIGQFLNLLEQNAITAVADVRSNPYSRYSPHFNKAPLSASLNESSIHYVFLGQELGGRPKDNSCYVDGQIQYPLVSATNSFQEGLGRLQEGIQKFRVAVMCSEADPTNCHRFLLISRELVESGTPVNHILGDGQIHSHELALDNLRKRLHVEQLDLFSSISDYDSGTSNIIDKTYDEQAKRVAYINISPKGLNL